MGLPRPARKVIVKPARERPAEPVEPKREPAPEPREPVREPEKVPA